MKLKIIVALLAINIGVAQAAPEGRTQDTSVTPVDNTYAGSENEFIAGGTNNIGSVYIANPSAIDMYACVFALTAASCSDDMIIPAGSFRVKHSNYIRGLYLRSAAATISVSIIEGSGE